LRRKSLVVFVVVRIGVGIVGIWSFTTECFWIKAWLKIEALWIVVGKPWSTSFVEKAVRVVSYGRRQKKTRE